MRLHNDIAFGERLKQRRKALDLTQSALAQQVGCSVSTIKQLEAEVLRPSKRLAEQLADCLGVSPEERTSFIQAARVSSPTAFDAFTISPSAPLPRLVNLGRSVLSIPPTPLIGREDAITSVCRQLLRASVRLLTLIGPPGVGKTRLAIQLAMQVGNVFADGVAFIALTPIRDPHLVIPTIAQVLGIKEADQEPLMDTLASYLRDKRLLLVCDNFEQVVGAAPSVTSLLTIAPRLKILVTSRVALHVTGEHEFVVPPLALPDLQQPLPWKELQRYAAVQLFVQQSQAAKQDFTLTDANADAVAKICVHLDGLPLAIQLAAVRSKVLPPQALLRRLDQRLKLLTASASDIDARHRTLREAIAWSYDLLNVEEQALFRRISVFVGGCTLAAAAAVWEELTTEDESIEKGRDTDQFAILDRLTALIDHSLLQQTVDPDDEPRFAMLETIREYALEQLEAQGEGEVIRQRHAEYYLRLIVEAEPAMYGPDQAIWLERLESEYDNLRTVLSWALDSGAVEIGLRLAGGLWGFWIRRGYLSEARDWLDRLLAVSHDAPASLQAKAFHVAGIIVRNQGDYEQAGRFFEQALALRRKLGDHVGILKSLHGVGNIAYNLGDYQRAIPILEECLSLAQELGDKPQMALELLVLGEIAYYQGDYYRASDLSEKSLALRRELDDKWGIGMALSNLGNVANLQGHYDQAMARHQECEAFFRTLGDKRNIACALVDQGHVELAQGNDGRAIPLIEESMTMFQELGEKWGQAVVYDHLGYIKQRQGDYTQAVAFYEHSLACYRETGDRRGIAQALNNLGEGMRCLGDITQAIELHRQSLGIYQAIGDKLGLIESIEGLAAIAITWREPVQAARLFGAAACLRESLGAPHSPVAQPSYDCIYKELCAQLGENAYRATWAEGAAMTMEQAISAAMRLETQRGSAPMSNTVHRLTHPGGLTVREVEVLGLVAQGLTNKEIAEHLVVSPRTVNAHLNSIYSKLGISSRSAATRFAVENGLV